MILILHKLYLTLTDFEIALFNWYPNMLLKISTIVLVPALILQGYRVKKNTPRLAEPQGLRKGVIGQGKALSILILGDSAAAGVGVEDQREALLGGYSMN